MRKFNFSWIFTVFFFSFIIYHVYTAPCTATVCGATSTCHQIEGTTDKHTCECHHKLSGPNCEDERNLCKEYCKTPNGDCPICNNNAASCEKKESYPYFICTCLPFHAGEYCEKPNNPCYINPGICGRDSICKFDSQAGYLQCICGRETINGKPESNISARGGAQFSHNGFCVPPTSVGIGGTGSVVMSPAELTIWWSIFTFLICALLYCCLSICREKCSVQGMFARAAAKQAVS